MIFTCARCGLTVEKKRPSKKQRFCSHHCYNTWNKESGNKEGRFKKGIVPWNKGLKGIHCSPQSEFKKGNRPKSALPVGTVLIRNHKRDGDRAYIKVAEPNKWKPRALFVWEQHHGNLEKGLIIHHDDRNKLNDNIWNLKPMTRAEHMKEHKMEFEPQRRLALRRRNDMPSL